MRIFVAGATGAVGRRLLPLLVADGHEVVGLARDPRAAAGVREVGASPVVADVFDRGALAAAVGAVRPEVVVHQLTALGDGDLVANARIREVGTRNLVDAALAAGTRRMVAQSICWAYGEGVEPATEGERLDLEAAQPRQTSVAGVVALETAVRDVPEWVVLRYGTLYGPGTWHARDGRTAGRLTANRDVSSFLHVDDAAAAAMAALDWPTGPVNVCDDEPAAATEWVPAFCRAVDVPAPAPMDAERTGWARGADNRYARKDLGWIPRYPTWRTGFATL
jgi:nucleoside-diphosphate-sugar epimerase